MFELAIEVRWRDCDMFQHVNNAVYFTYFEEARDHFWRALMGEAFAGIDFIIAENTCTYLAPAHYREQLIVTVAVAAIGTKSFQLAYQVRAAKDGRAIARGRSVQVMYDYARQATMPLADALRTRLEAWRAPAGTNEPEATGSGSASAAQ